MKIKGKLIELLSGTTALMEMTLIPEGPDDLHALDMRVGDEYIIADVSVIKEELNGRAGQSNKSDQ